MSQPMKNHSKMLYLKARQLFEEAKIKFEDGSIKSEARLIDAVFQSFQDFFVSMGKPNMVPRYAPEQGPPWSDDYNQMMNEIKKDLELLFQEVDILGKTLYTDFNHNMVQHDIVHQQYETIFDKMKDLELYAGINAKHQMKFGRDHFLNKNKIDYSRISGTPLEVVNGAVTLPQSKSVNVAKDAKVSIVVGNRKENKFILGTESNGFPGNNTEIHSVTDEVLSNKNYLPTFLGENDNHSDYAAVLDGSPNTWFEYEKVNVRDHDKVRVAKNIGWEYQVHENQTIAWAEDPEDGVLKLHMQIVLEKETIINQVNVNMYMPSNYGAKTAIVKNILVSDGKTPPKSVLQRDKKNDQYSFHFPPVKAKIVSILFEQPHKYMTDIGHIFYEKKTNMKETSEYALEKTTKRHPYAPRTEGPLISIEDLGIDVQSDMHHVDAKYPLVDTDHKRVRSIGETMNRLLKNVDLDLIDMGVEKFEGFRWCIGIRDIEILSCEYETEGELVTHPFYFDYPLEKISLNVEENIPSIFTNNPALKYEWLQYYVSIDDGAMWHPITPIDHETQSENQPPKIYTIHHIEHSKQRLDQKKGYLESEFPVYSLRLKIVARRPEDYTSEGFSIKNSHVPSVEFPQSSPILNSYLFQAEMRVNTFDSEESENVLVSIDESGVINQSDLSPGQEDPNQGDEEDNDTIILNPNLPGDHEGDGTEQIKVWILNQPNYQLNKCPDNNLTVRSKVKSPNALSKVLLLIDGQVAKTEIINITIKEKTFEWILSKDEMPNQIGDTFEVKVVGYDILNDFDTEEFIAHIVDCENGVIEGDYPDPESKVKVVIDEPSNQYKNGTNHVHMCQEDWLSLSQYCVTGYAESAYNITKLEFYEKGILKEMRELTIEEQKKKVQFEFCFPTSEYYKEGTSVGPKVVAYNENNHHGSDVELIHVFDCQSNEEISNNFTLSITNKKEEWCVDEELFVNIKANSPTNINKIEFYINGALIDQRENLSTQEDITFKVYPTSLVLGLMSFMVKGYNESETVSDTDIVQIIDCTNIPPEQRPTDPYLDTLKTVIDYKFTEICECDDINIYGSIQSPNQLTGKTLRINGVSVDPNHLGTPPSDDPCQSENLEVASISSQQVSENIIDSQSYAHDPEKEPEAFESFGEWLDAFEEKNNCGCRSKKTFQSMAMSEKSFTPMNASNVYEESFYWTIPYWKLRELGGSPETTMTIEVESYDETGDRSSDQFEFMIKDCDTPPVDEDGNPRVRECWYLESIVVQYFDHVTNSLKEETIPSNMLPFEFIDNGAGSKITIGWRKTLKAPVVMLTRGYDESGYAFQIHAVGINYLDEYDQSHRLWSTTIAESTNGCKNVEKMIGDPNGKDTSWIVDMENGQYSTSPSLGGINDYVTFSINNDWIAKACQVDSDFSPLDNQQPTEPADPNDPTDPRNDEPKTELYDCAERTHVIFQYYNDATKELELYKVNISSTGKDTYDIATKNGSVTIAVGWSEYFQGLVIQNQIATGIDNVLLTAIGIVYRDVYGDAQTSWSTASRYKTNGAQYQDFAIGEKKMLADISWINQDGTVDYVAATFVGKQGDLMAFSMDQSVINSFCQPEKSIDTVIGIDPNNPPDVPTIEWIDPPSELCLFDQMEYFDVKITDELEISKVEYGISVNGVGIVGPIFEEVSGVTEHTITIPLDPTNLTAGDSLRIHVAATNSFGTEEIKYLDLLASNCDTLPPVITIDPVNSTLIDSVTGKICYDQLNADGTFCVTMNVTDDSSGVDRWEASYGTWTQVSEEAYPNQTLDTGVIQICPPIVMPDAITETGEAPQVDIVFILDTSGSMSGAIDNVKTNLTTFVNHLISEGLDARAGYLGSRFDSYQQRSNPVDINLFSLDGVGVNSGGWESLSWGQLTDTTYGGMSLTPQFRTGSKRFFIIVTDTYISTTLPNTLIDTMNQNDIEVSFIARHNSDGTLIEPEYQTVADETNGQIYNLDNSNFGDNMTSLAENIVQSSSYYPDSTHTIAINAWDKSGKTSQETMTLDFTDCSYDPMTSFTVRTELPEDSTILLDHSSQLKAFAYRSRSGEVDVTNETSFEDVNGIGTISGSTFTGTSLGEAKVYGTYEGESDYTLITVTDFEPDTQSGTGWFSKTYYDLGSRARYLHISYQFSESGGGSLIEVYEDGELKFGNGGGLFGTFNLYFDPSVDEKVKIVITPLNDSVNWEYTIENQ